MLIKLMLDFVKYSLVWFFQLKLGYFKISLFRLGYVMFFTLGNVSFI